jgi:hypothetical protein
VRGEPGLKRRQFEPGQRRGHLLARPATRFAIAHRCVSDGPSYIRNGRTSRRNRPSRTSPEMPREPQICTARSTTRHTASAVNVFAIAVA